MEDMLKKLLELFEKNATKIYLIIFNVLLVVFGIWFSNVGLLPFANISDFGFFVLFGVILAIYRPSWTFAFFVGTLALENVNLAPKGFPVSLHPYQFFALVTLLALAVHYFTKRLNFSLPKFSWQDGLVLLFVISGFLSAFVSANKSTSFKQALVALSFAIIYFLVRVYVQSWQDLKRVLPFFISSSLIVLLYAIWQNVRFLHGANAFEVMPGRPNATFSEPDWLGIYLVFLLAIFFTICRMFALKKGMAFWANFLLTSSYLVVLYVVLILTVSRSAWLGAILVTIGYLKVVLYDGTLKISQWRWKKFTNKTAWVVCIFILSFIFSLKLTRFQIAGRAQSTGGLQQITLSCPANVDYVVPEKIASLDDVKPCRHIDLEEIEKERALGNVITNTYRPDPTVNIRSQIYKTALAQIKQHPIFGIGWGNISKILGTDERGAGLNASNIFLEIYLGSGLLGIVSFVILIAWILVKAIYLYLKKYKTDNFALIFILLGWTAIVIPNLFNSGIFLGFLWMYLAVAVSLLEEFSN